MKKKNRWRRCLLAGLLAVVLLALAACGSSSDEASEKTEKTEDTEKSDEEKVLNVGVSSIKDVPFNPYYFGTNGEQFVPLYDSLIALEDGEFVPCLAAEWTLSDDKTSMTMTLRDDVYFHDGSQMTSADVKFTFEYYKNENSAHSESGKYQKYIDTIEAADEYTVVFHFTQPCTEFEYIFSNASNFGGIVLPKDYFEKVGEEGYAANPIGTGPFKLESFEPGVQMVYAANEDYWKGAPQYDKLVIRQISEESTIVAELQTGGLDFAALNESSVSVLEKDDNVSVDRVPYDSTCGVFMDGTYKDTGAATQSLAVRQAMSLAINKQEIVDSLFNGNADAPAVWGICPDTPGYDGSRKVSEYDPEKAKALLKEAGYPEKFANPTVKFYVSDTKSYGMDLAQVLVNYWEAVGLQVEITASDTATIFSQRTSDEFAGSIYYCDPPVKYSIDDAISMEFTSYSSFALTSGNDIVDNGAKQLLSTDIKDRGALANQIWDAIDEECVCLPIVCPSQGYGVSEKVAEWNSNYGSHWSDWFYSFVLD